MERREFLKKVGLLIAGISIPAALTLESNSQREELMMSDFLEEIPFCPMCREHLEDRHICKYDPAGIIAKTYYDMKKQFTFELCKAYPNITMRFWDGTIKRIPSLHAPEEWLRHFPCKM